MSEVSDQEEGKQKSLQLNVQTGTSQEHDNGKTVAEFPEAGKTVNTNPVDCKRSSSQHSKQEDGNKCSLTSVSKKDRANPSSRLSHSQQTCANPQQFVQRPVQQPQHEVEIIEID